MFHVRTVQHRWVRFGASDYAARILLSTREYALSFQFEVKCWFNEDIQAVLAALDGPTVEINRREEPFQGEKWLKTGSVDHRGFEDFEIAPIAV